MDLLAELEEKFGTRDLYEVLKAPKTASASKLKSCYYKAALKYHPDRAGDEASTELFQLLSKVHTILANDEARAAYDETGAVYAEGVESAGDCDWMDYWRLLYPEVTEDAIDEFSTKYKGSEEEAADLRAAYISGEGDMNVVFETVMLSDPLVDEDRFRKMIDGWIENNLVDEYPSYRSNVEKTRKARAARFKSESKQAAKIQTTSAGKRGKRSRNAAAAASRSKGSSEDNLADLILARRSEREKMWTKFEARYTKGKPSRALPDEEEFQKLQAQLFGAAKDTTAVDETPPTKPKRRTAKGQTKSKRKART
eukprot:m.85633 g.85633  ORF g.85633 m.85633 type:complete len:311 (+) comp12783_c1_seq1:134-1066(+)